MHTSHDILEAISFWESQLDELNEKNFLSKIFKRHRKTTNKKKKPDKNTAAKDIQHILENEEIGNWPLIVARKVGEDNTWRYHLVTGFEKPDAGDRSTLGYTVLKYDSKPIKGRDLLNNAKKLADLVKTNISDEDIRTARNFEQAYPELAEVIKTERISTGDLPVDAISRCLDDYATSRHLDDYDISKFRNIEPRCKEYLGIINNSQDFESNAKKGFLFIYDENNNEINDNGKKAIAADTKYERIMVKGNIIYFIIKCQNADKIEKRFKTKSDSGTSTSTKKLKPAIF